MKTARHTSAHSREARRGSSESTWFRSDRVFEADDQWYFHTREGVDVGPYETRFEAEIEAGMLRELLLEVPQGESTMPVIREFVLESFAMGRPLMPYFRDELLAS